MKRWTEDEVKILRKSYYVKSPEELELLFDRSYIAIKSKARATGLNKSNPRWTNEEIELLRSIYYKKSKNEIIGTFPDRTWCSIKCTASKNGITKPLRNSVNDNFFSEYTEESCYIAGFIAADGCIRNNSVKVKIVEYDRCILEYIKLETNSESKIHTHSVKLSNNNQCSINITSDQIVNDLYENFNITPRKSLTLQYPKQIPDEMQKYFILGHFDGDGCFSVNNNLLNASIVAPKWFIEDERAAIKKLSGINIIRKPYMLKNGVTARLSISNAQSLQFGSWLYSDSKFYLKRKFNVYRSVQ